MGSDTINRTFMIKFLLFNLFHYPFSCICKNWTHISGTICRTRPHYQLYYYSARFL